MIEVKPLRKKELKRMIRYQKKGTWDLQGCFNCKFSHESAIRISRKVPSADKDKCGLHEFIFHRNFKCDVWEAREIF